MKSFSFTHDQIVNVISALVSEELSRSGKKQIDFLTAASWNEQTALGTQGIDLTIEERDLCHRRIKVFFGCGEELQLNDAALSLGDWAISISNAIDKKLNVITFTPAGRQETDADCVHSAYEIFADAAAAANLFHGRRRLLSLVAPHSLLGFALTVLTPNLQRIPTLDVRSMAPDLLQNTLQFGDVLVASPTLWRYILEQGVTAPDNTMGVFFGEPMAPELSAEMRQAGFGAQREIYGSTEDGLIGWRDSPTENFVLFDHWRKDGGKLLRFDGKTLSQSIVPMDVLTWSGDRRFVLSGRRDGAIQIGAINVFPDKIAQKMQGHSFVEGCKIRIGKHKGGINRLIAHIKLKQSAAPTEATVREIDQFCRSSLRPQERPGIFHFEESLDHL